MWSHCAFSRQYSASHHKTQCRDMMLPTHLTTVYEQKRKVSTKNQKVNDIAWQPGCDLKEIHAITTSSIQEVQTTEAILIHCQKEQKAHERNDQLPESERPPIEQTKIRKALAPFSIICQNMTQIKVEQCRKRDQFIFEALKKDRDSKFAKMGTWKITTMVSKDCKV